MAGRILTSLILQHFSPSYASRCLEGHLIPCGISSELPGTRRHRRTSRTVKNLEKLSKLKSIKHFCLHVISPKTYEYRSNIPQFSKWACCKKYLKDNKYSGFHFTLKIRSVICPRTLSVPQSSHVFSNYSPGTLLAYQSKGYEAWATFILFVSKYLPHKEQAIW